MILVQYRGLKNDRPASTLSVIIIDRLSDDQILKMHICSTIPKFSQKNEPSGRTSKI